jgi:hypothetical protein
MKKSQAASVARLYTPRATLCALGLKVRSLKLFDTVAEHVRIRRGEQGPPKQKLSSVGQEISAFDFAFHICRRGPTGRS